MMDSIRHYRMNYYRPEINGQDITVRPWDLISIIKSMGGLNKRLLDIGCGSAKKLIPLSESFEEIIGIEPSEQMRIVANQVIVEKNCHNILIENQQSGQIDSVDESFDVVTSMLSKWDATEIFRLLKPGGSVVIETIGNKDKINIKLPFGCDKNGLRGQKIKYSDGELESIYFNDFSQLFESVEVKSGEWNTSYTVDGLNLLFEETSTIRGYNALLDKNIVDEIIKSELSENGIIVRQNRILIIAKKPA